MSQTHPPTGSPPASSPHRATTWISRALVAAGLGLLVLLGCSTAASASPANEGGSLAGTVSGIVDQTPVIPIVESVTSAPGGPQPPAPESVPVTSPSPLPATPAESPAASPTSPAPVAPTTAPVTPIVQSVEERVIETTAPATPIVQSVDNQVIDPLAKTADPLVQSVEEQVIETTAPATPILQSVDNQVIDPLAKTAGPLVSEVTGVTAPLVDRVSRALPSTTEFVADSLAPLLGTPPTALDPLLRPVAPTGVVGEPAHAPITSPLHEAARSRAPMSAPVETPGAPAESTTQTVGSPPLIPQVTGTDVAHPPVPTAAPPPTKDLRTGRADGNTRLTDETDTNAGSGLPLPASAQPATGPIPACPVQPTPNSAVGLLAMLSTSATTGHGPSTCLRAIAPRATAPHPTLTPDVSPD